MAELLNIKINKHQPLSGFRHDLAIIKSVSFQTIITNLYLFTIFSAIMSCWLRWALIVIFLVSVNSEKDEACETLPSEIHIIKEEFDELGRLQRTCNADIAVNKCEGACNSQVQPSVITPNGFLKVSITISIPPILLHIRAHIFNLMFLK